jgi:hypothetical protein
MVPPLHRAGQWKHSQRYQLTVRLPNPPASTSAAVNAPSFWMAPLTYAYGSGGSGAFAFAVRGSKQGAMCALRPAARPALAWPLFNACAWASAQGLVAAGTADVEVRGILELCGDPLFSACCSPTGVVILATLCTLKWAPKFFRWPFPTGRQQVPGSHLTRSRQSPCPPANRVGNGRCAWTPSARQP